jgi:hypothetical protein
LLLHLEGKGKAKNTVRAVRNNLRFLAMKVDLRDQQAVELTIARAKKKNGQPITNNYKSKLCDCYQHYCKFLKILWEKPIYTPDERGIQPPTDEQVRMLISAAKDPLGIKIQISAETGLRPIEIQGEKGLKVRDIHTDQQTITAINTKNCNARPPMKITPELNARLQAYITKHNLQPNDLLFTGYDRQYGKQFRRFRNKLAIKLEHPAIRTIRLYDLRHYYVTKQLRRTQNAEIVRQIVGHKKLNTTQKYMHLIAGTSGEWIVDGTSDKERAKQLLEEDFTYQLTTPDGTMIFRKPK